MITSGNEGVRADGSHRPSQESCSEENGPSTILSQAAMAMVMSGGPSPDASAETDTSVRPSDVQGLTQAYYLVEEDEKSVATADARSSSSVNPVARAAFAGDARTMSDAQELVAAVHDSAEPQGLSQLFYLDPEAEVAAAEAISATSPSFLREKLGVPVAVVQDLRQVREPDKRNHRSRRRSQLLAPSLIGSWPTPSCVVP